MGPLWAISSVVSLAIHVSKHLHDEKAVLIAECQNVTKIKELEYMIDSYSKMVEKQNRNLEREKERVELQLFNIMPKRVYEELKTFGVTTPRCFASASVLMLDFVYFTDMAVVQDPAALIAELNDIFSAFDRIAEQFGCERIKTIGDAYMAVCGVPEPVPEHAQIIATVALDPIGFPVRGARRRGDQGLGKKRLYTLKGESRPVAADPFRSLQIP